MELGSTLGVSLALVRGKNNSTSIGLNLSQGAGVQLQGEGGGVSGLGIAGGHGNFYHAGQRIKHNLHVGVNHALNGSQVAAGLGGDNVGDDGVSSEGHCA